MLRQLLLDASPLLHHVNRERRVRISFRVNATEPAWRRAGLRPPVFWSRHDGFDPETAAAALETADLELPAFLAQPAMVAHGTELTVKDVIRQVAHVIGGVHAGKERESIEHLMSSLSASLRVGGKDPLIGSLEAIGRVVVRALAPLTAVVERETKSADHADDPAERGRR